MLKRLLGGSRQRVVQQTHFGGWGKGKVEDSKLSVISHRSLVVGNSGPMRSGERSEPYLFTEKSNTSAPADHMLRLNSTNPSESGGGSSVIYPPISHTLRHARHTQVFFSAIQGKPVSVVHEHPIWNGTKDRQVQVDVHCFFVSNADIGPTVPSKPCGGWLRAPFYLHQKIVVTRVDQSVSSAREGEAPDLYSVDHILSGIDGGPALSKEAFSTANRPLVINIASARTSTVNPVSLRMNQRPGHLLKQVAHSLSSERGGAALTSIIQRRCYAGN